MEATAVDMVATTARGLLMPSLRLRPRLSLDTATAVDMAMVVMAVDMVATMARGLLMPSLRLMLLLRPATATVDTAMVVTVVVMVATAADTTAMARGLLSAATATAGATATGVSYHRIRRSELSQKQNHKNSQ